MKQEAINKLVIEGLPNQFDIYEDLKRYKNITTHTLITTIKQHKDLLSDTLIDFIETHHREEWSYQMAEDTVQGLYQTFYEFITEKLQIYGQTPSGYKRANIAWKHHYRSKIRL